MADRTHDGIAFRTLNIIDEFTRECLQIRMERNHQGEDVQECLTELYCQRGLPVYTRSENGSEFCNGQIRTWLNALAVKPLLIEPGSPWENGFIENFNGKFRDELLNRELSYTLKEAQIIIEQWRKEYNTVRPHIALGYRPPLPKRYCSLNWQLRCSLQWPSLPLINWTDQRVLVIFSIKPLYQDTWFGCIFTAYFELRW